MYISIPVVFMSILLIFVIGYKTSTWANVGLTFTLGDITYVVLAVMLVIEVVKGRAFGSGNS